MLTFCLVSAAQSQADWIIQASIDNPAPYVGEPISYTVQIRYPENSEPLISTEPIFEGFGRTTFRPEITSTVDTSIQGTYIITTQVISLIPLQPGTFTISPYQIITAATPFSESEKIESETIQVTVLPLPPGAPDSFTNAVGQFSVESSASTTTLTIGEAFQLSVRISGTGNLEQITPPAVDLPVAWISSFSARTVDYENQQYGTREFQWMIVPADSSVLTIPELVFAYYNPQIDSYEVRRTVPIALTFQPDTGQPNQTQAMRDPATTAIPLMQIPPNQPPGVLAWLPIGLMLSAPLFSLLTISFKRRNKQQVRRQARPGVPVKAVYERLDKLSNLDTGQGYEKLESILLEYIRTRTGKTWTAEQFQKNGRSTHAELWNRLAPILDETSNARYAPASRQDFLRQVELVRATIRRLEDQ
jgi:hypothetical protein